MPSRYERVTAAPKSIEQNLLDLTVQFHNRNKDKSEVIMSRIADGPKQQVQGSYKDAMNKGTSQVNWDDITNNQ